MCACWKYYFAQQVLKIECLQLLLAALPEAWTELNSLHEDLFAGHHNEITPVSRSAGHLALDLRGKGEERKNRQTS